MPEWDNSGAGTGAGAGAGANTETGRMICDVVVGDEDESGVVCLGSIAAAAVGGKGCCTESEGVTAALLTCSPRRTRGWLSETIEGNKAEDKGVIEVKIGAVGMAPESAPACWCDTDSPWILEILLVVKDVVVAVPEVVLEVETWSVGRVVGTVVATLAEVPAETVTEVEDDGHAGIADRT